MAVRFLAIDLILALPHGVCSRRGAPKAQGLTAAIAVAGPSPVPSIAPDDPVSLDSTGADVLMRAFAILRIYTSLSGTTNIAGLATKVACDLDEESRLVQRATDPPTILCENHGHITGHGSLATQRIVHQLFGLFAAS